MLIYLATNLLNGKQYVGLTTKSMKERMEEHFYSAKSNSPYKFHRAIRKYGEDGFDWTVIDTAETEDELKEKEIYWIAELDTFKNGYNMTLGGEGLLGFNHSEETKEKLRKPKSEQARENMSKARQGMKLSDEHIENIALGHGAKSFLVYKINGEFVGEYLVQGVCAKELNLDFSSISDILRGEKLVQHKGYTFIYKDEYTEELLQERIKKARPHKRLSEEEVVEVKMLLKEGKKYKEIANIFGVDPTTIGLIKREKIWGHIKIEDIGA